METAYFDRLRTASRVRDSILCIGLDPDPERIRGGLDGAIRFCREVVYATADIACCYKPNSAFWEQYGPDGWRGLASVRETIPSDLPVLLDCKRADVPRTMAAYARATFEALEMDAATVHGYHGTDSLVAFTRYADRGVYVVTHTSNPGREDLQHLRIGDTPLYVAVADLAAGLDAAGNVGLVVGATATTEARHLRARLPQMPFLMPGIGRQGGDLEAAVRAAWNGDPASCLVSVSGAVLYAEDPRAAAGHWRDRGWAMTDPSGRRAATDRHVRSGERRAAESSSVEGARALGTEVGNDVE